MVVQAQARDAADGALLAEGFAKNPLAGSTAKLHLGRQPGTPANQTVIEKRDPHLEGMRHRHAIRKRQQVARKVELQIGKEGTVQRLRFRCAGDDRIEELDELTALIGG